MRLFIAVPLDESLKAGLRSAQVALSSWQAKIGLARDFHITLKFLGDVPDDSIGAIVSALEAVHFDGFTIRLSDLGFFPNPKRPRVVWVGPEPVEDIIRLQEAIDRVLVDRFERERHFHPHITLGRVKHWESGGTIQIEPMEQHVETFELIQSSLTTEGPIYKTIKSFKKRA
jgi:RNA 2',3'-cyclic 3'-phosphodiesterase